LDSCIKNDVKDGCQLRLENFADLGKVANSCTFKLVFRFCALDALKAEFSECFKSITGKVFLATSLS
jgi:hypothetical protein